jgi:tetratricopeptide (TPR) repeat protein
MHFPCAAHGGRLARYVLYALTCAAVTTGLIACSSLATSDSGTKKEPAGAAGGTAESGKAAAAGSTSAAGAAGSAAGNGATGAPPAEIPPRALADFNRAVGMMRSGNTTEAELEFKQISVTYPQLSTPYVNLGILFRKNGHLDQSEEALKSAVQRNGSSAVAWTELGATQRMRGEFKDAADSYEKAIAADPNYAAAYRNLGVVTDLYLGDPERALTAFERYKQITGEDKPVSTWIAELRQRTGKPAPRPAATAAPATGVAPAGAASRSEAPAGGGPSGVAPEGGVASPATAPPGGAAPDTQSPAAPPAGKPNTGE